MTHLDHIAAFPAPEDTPANQSGLSVREYFAARALQGLAANPVLDPTNANAIAQLAWRLADGVLEHQQERHGLSHALRQQAYQAQRCYCNNCNHDRASVCDNTCGCCLNTEVNGQAPCWQV